MRSKLFTSAAVFGLALAIPAFAGSAFAQTATYQSVPNGMNSGKAMPAPGMAQQSVPNGVSAGQANPAPGETVQSIANGQNSGHAVPAPSPAIAAVDTGTGVAPAPLHRHRTASAIRTDGPSQGVNSSEPMSTRASNIDQADTRSDIAPALPTPNVGPNADARQYLAAAKTALQRGQTGMAQEALERAETRILDRSTDPANAGTPADGPRIKDITDARDALARGDRDAAMQAISRS